MILHRRPAGEREDLIELIKQHSRDESEVVIMAQTAAEFLIEQGKAEGIIEGKQAAILQLLRVRFQNVPETLTDQITSIESPLHLDTLLERAIAAQSLDEIHI